MLIPAITTTGLAEARVSALWLEMIAAIDALSHRMHWVRGNRWLLQLRRLSTRRRPRRIVAPSERTPPPTSMAFTKFRRQLVVN
jgi:hypothetical protein